MHHDWLFTSLAMLVSVMLAAASVASGYEITDAEDKEDIREPFYINDATYADIIAAASAQTRPMIMKAAADDTGGE